MADVKTVGISDNDSALMMGRLMLRYRPIAPKPMIAGDTRFLSMETNLTSQTKKRRLDENGGIKRGRRSKKTKETISQSIVTLPLMPETPERKEKPRAIVPVTETLVSPNITKAIVMSVTVERLTETWDVAFNGVNRRKDVLRRWLLIADFPAFISDDADLVIWTNAACRKMVPCGFLASDSPEMAVEMTLETRGLIPIETCSAFTCMTSVSYGSRRLAAPCDVWRVEEGGLAWRLDLNAALSL